MNNLRILDNCPVCGCVLNDENIAHVNVKRFVDDESSIVTLPVCEDCHDEYITCGIDLSLDSHFTLFITECGVERFTPLYHYSHLPDVQCACCGRKPYEISEYKYTFLSNTNLYKSPSDVVVKDEVTYNPVTRAFYCTSCFIEMDEPLSPCSATYHDASGYEMRF